MKILLIKIILAGFLFTNLTHSSSLCESDEACYIKGMPLLNQSPLDWGPYSGSGYCVPTSVTMMLIGAIADEDYQLSDMTIMCEDPDDDSVYQKRVNSMCQQFKNYMSAKRSGKSLEEIKYLEFGKDSAGKYFQGKKMNDRIYSMAPHIGFNGSGTSRSFYTMMVNKYSDLFTDAISGDFRGFDSNGFFQRVFQNHKPVAVASTKVGQWKKRVNAGLTTFHFEYDPKGGHAIALKGYDTSTGNEKVIFHDPWGLARNTIVRNIGADPVAEYRAFKYNPKGEFLASDDAPIDNMRKLMPENGYKWHSTKTNKKGKLVFRLKHKKSGDIVDIKTPKNFKIAQNDKTRWLIKTNRNEQYPNFFKENKHNNKRVLKHDGKQFGSFNFVPTEITIGSGNYLLPHNNRSSTNTRMDHNAWGWKIEGISGFMKR